MTDNELLLSISNIMDKKLYPLEKRMDSFEHKLDTAERNLKADISRLDAKIDTVEQNLKADISRLNAKIDTVEQNLKADIHLINLTLENIVLPRLNEIESCYVSTSERYLHETDKFISFENDLSVMKDVMIEHSERLNVIGA